MPRINETFNTVKNQGYHFEHNFGHGNHAFNASAKVCGDTGLLM